MNFLESDGKSCLAETEDMHLCEGFEPLYDIAPEICYYWDVYSDECTHPDIRKAPFLPHVLY